MKVLPAEVTASQPVNILESVKHAHQLRGRGLRVAVLAVLWCGSESGPESSPLHTHKRTHTHTHIRAHKHTCRKAAEVCSEQGQTTKKQKKPKTEKKRKKNVGEGGVGWVGEAVRGRVGVGEVAVVVAC